MKIKILGGDNEIGGNKILVEHKGTKILLDFGMSFGLYKQYFSEFLQPRKCTALTDFFELGLLPKLHGVYREDYLAHMGAQKESQEIDALFLSHAHADHAQYIHFLRFDIPIYATEATKIILDCLEETGSNPLSDLVTACEAFTFYTNKKGELSRVTRKRKDYVHDRKFHLMQPNKKVSVGFFEVEMLPVDHSIPGSCGFIIYSDEGNLVYTGDIRFHGLNPELSHRFVEVAAKAKPKWLICEGTRIKSTGKTEGEDWIKGKLSEVISKAKGLVFVEHPIRDIDRVYSILKAARKNKRVFVVNLKLAYIIDALSRKKLCPFSLDEVKVLILRKGWGLIGKKDASVKQIESDYFVWERSFLDQKNVITAKKIKSSPNDYIISMSMWEIQQLIDIKPKQAIWIKSSCEPFNEEMEFDEERKKNWLKHFDIKSYQIHASGHASGDEIRKMISDIAPQELIQVHTEHAEDVDWK
jgi:ribonuclease J